MNGKGSGRRPAAKDNPNAYQDNYEKVFGTRAKKKETKEKKDKKWYTKFELARVLLSSPKINSPCM